MRGSTVEEIAHFLNRTVACKTKVEGFEVDSRKILPGFIFFALKGEQVDGHDYLLEVGNKQAAAAVVSSEYKNEIKNLPLIRVTDVKQALHDLAKLALEQKKRTVVAVTGSVGKTTTKEFISTILEGSFRVNKTPGNANSQTGVPIAILNSDHQEDIFVVEMGMNHHGEIAALVRIAPPDIAVVTKIALAHALFFPGGLEEVAKSKSEILEHPHTQIAYINKQAKQFLAIREVGAVDKTYYSYEENALDGEAVQLYQKEGQFCISQYGESSPTFSLPFHERHLCENFLAAACVARQLGMDWKTIIDQAQKLRSCPMRFEKIEKNGITYINDAYNANPESMAAALQNLPKPKSGKVIAVLGEMRELGLFSEEAHRQVGQLAGVSVDMLLCFGEECKYMAEEFAKTGRIVRQYIDFSELHFSVKQIAQPGDVVLVKASNSLKLWKVLDNV